MNDVSNWYYVNHHLIQIAKGSKSAKIKQEWKIQMLSLYKVHTQTVNIMNYKYIFFVLLGFKIPTKNH